ncbi:MAG: hypothetical protein A2X09_15095 [Bacteroidetes bacterium GWF2_43_11]|nr:MAG: hypothetical protein A2X09_15095 [Bacteroidetes bacterium GWF2_43_11]
MENNIIENIEYANQLIAIIIRNNYSKNGVEFFTPNDFSQQLAYMNHKKGKVIAPHIHNPVKREIHLTKEVLVIKKGILKVDFYTDNRNYIESRYLEAGDVILLASGGHGFEVIEEIEMIEIKQGPYAGELDKTCFSPISS